MRTSVARANAAGEQTVRGFYLPARFAVFAAVAASCCVLSSLQLLQGPIAAALAIGAIAIAMWHGAYDHVQAEQVLAPALGRHWLPIFLFAYVGLGATVLLGWYCFPLLSLLLFFAYSAWHFGTEPEENTPGPAAGTVAFFFGAVPIVAACRWHGGEVAPILAVMLARRPDALASAQGLVAVLSSLCWAVILGVCLGIVAGWLGRRRLELLGVLAVQVLVFRVCGPLPAFAIFFCFWHTPEHLLATSTGAESVKRNLARNLRAGVVPWLLSLLLLGAALICGRHAWAAYQSEVFILLSALTVPHMMLNELGRSRWVRRSGMRGSFA